MTTDEYLKADMWCHFGRAIIRGPDEGSTFFQSCPRARKPMRLRLPLPIVTSCMHAQRYRSIDTPRSKISCLNKQGLFARFQWPFEARCFKLETIQNLMVLKVRKRHVHDTNKAGICSMHYIQIDILFYCLRGSWGRRVDYRRCKKKVSNRQWRTSLENFIQGRSWSRWKHLGKNQWLRKHSGRICWLCGKIWLGIFNATW